MSLQFISDDKDNKIAVILPTSDYKKSCKTLEKLEPIRTYGDAKASKSEATPFEKLPHKRK